MTPLKYLDAIRNVLKHLEQTQLPAVERAAGLIVQALTRQGVVYCSEIGHGIQGDFFNRAGGMAPIHPFTVNVNIASPVPRCHQNRTRPGPWEQDLETIRFAVQSSNLRAGDVMLVASVSGRNRGPIELALACRAKGARVIGFTSLAYKGVEPSLHPSGKRLEDAVDQVIDIGAPLGDAAVDIPGYDIKLMPVSGVAMDVAGWLIFGRAMELMAAGGKPLSVFPSVNRADGQARYDQIREQYEKRGY